MQQITVEWLDSNMEFYQVSKEELPKPIIILTSGYFVEQTSRHIIVARDLIGDEYRGCIAIPQVAVIKKTLRK